MFHRKCTLHMWMFLLAVFFTSCDINTPEVKQHKIVDDIKSTGLPVIIVNSNHEVNLLEKVICEIGIEDSSNLKHDPFVGKIKTRLGDFGQKNPKPSYSLSLTEPQSFLGMKADREWILNGSYIDKTFLRDKLVYYLFANMDQGIYTAKSEFVILYLNGQFKGLYLLTEKLNENRLNVKTDDRYAVIFKEPEIFTSKGRLYNQKYPDPGLEDRSEYLFELKQLLFNSPDAEFYQNASQFFEMTNLANWQLLLQLTNNSQGLFSSFYIYRVSKNDKFRFTVWDYDESFGRNWDGSLQTGNIDIDNNILLKRLNESDTFRILLQNQWQSLRQNNTISFEIIENFIDANAQYISRSVTKNGNRFPLDGPLYYDTNTFQQEIDLMKEKILARIDYLDSLYNFENEHSNTELSD